MKINNYALSLLLILSTSLAKSQQTDTYSQKHQLQIGLDLLYKNTHCTQIEFCKNTESTEKVMIENALQFKSQLDELISTTQLKNLKLTNLKKNVQEFEFDSAIQKGGSHPADKVKGLIYLPANASNCEAEFPATLLIHKLSVDIESEKQIASVSASLNKGIVMLIYLPHFGPRRLNPENFITKDQESFEKNILQALSDIHLSYLLLKRLPQVQKNNIGLMGLSLGGMITLISAGLDPIFDRYATNVGGGDLANIVTYRKTGDVDTQTGQALKDIDWSVDQARFHLSKFDAITWSQNVRNKKITMINAEKDELISRELSIDPLVEGYRKAGSEVNLVMHNGTHVFRLKEVGLRETLTKVMLPMLNFIGTNAPSAEICNGLHQN